MDLLRTVGKSWTTPPPARRGAAVITPARAAHPPRDTVLRAGRAGPRCPLRRAAGLGSLPRPGPLRAPLDGAVRSHRGGAARAADAGRAGLPGHAGPRPRGALGAAAGAGGCAGGSRRRGRGSPEPPSRSRVSPRSRRCFPAGTCLRRGTRSGLAGEPERPASSWTRGVAGLGGKGRSLDGFTRVAGFPHGLRSFNLTPSFCDEGGALGWLSGVSASLPGRMSKGQVRKRAWVPVFPTMPPGGLQPQ